jgi:hypothetical protein
LYKRSKYTQDTRRETERSNIQNINVSQKLFEISTTAAQSRSSNTSKYQLLPLLHVLLSSMKPCRDIIPTFETSTPHKTCFKVLHISANNSSPVLPSPTQAIISYFLCCVSSYRQYMKPCQNIIPTYDNKGFKFNTSQNLFQSFTYFNQQQQRSLARSTQANISYFPCCVSP